jgi:hypothetical protein
VLEQEYSIYNSILKPFIGEDLIVGKKYRSPCKGRRDSTASFSVKEIKGRLRWKDYGYSEATGDKIENLIIAVSETPIDFWQARDIIEQGNFPPIPFKSKKESEWRIKYGALDYSELSWWLDYNISPSTLKRFKTFGLRYMWRDKKLMYNYEKEPMAFVYLGETKEDWQGYFPRPLHTRPKFHKNGNWLFGWAQLPLTGKIVRFMSGGKDGMCAYEAAGIHPLAGNGETDFVAFKRVLPELKLRFRTLDILMDPDKPGRASERRLAEELKLPVFPFKYINTKDDMADISKKIGIKYLRDNLLY